MAGSWGRSARGAIAVALCLTLAACADSGGGATHEQGAPRATTARPAATKPVTAPTAQAAPSHPSPPTAPRPPTNTSPNELTLAFAGDVHFEREAHPLLADPSTALASLQPTLGAADFSMVNLETAITNRGTPIPGKPYAFRAPETAIDALVSAGVDAASMANNHAADFGAVGLTDTLAARKRSPIPIVGVGRDINDAFSQHIITVKGVRIAILASTQLPEQTTALYSATATRPGVAANLDMTALRKAVRRDAAAADLVVVMMHWGLDYLTCAEAGQKRTAQQLAADGADIIVGGHSHRVQGGGWLEGAYVGYGLGNFVWYRNDGLNGHTGVLTLTVDAKRARAHGNSTTPLVTKAVWTPMLIGADAVPRVAPADQTASLQAEWRRGMTCAGLKATPRAAGS